MLESIDSLLSSPRLSSLSCVQLIMACTSAIRFTSLPNPSNVGQRCGDSRRVLSLRSSLAQFRTGSRFSLSGQCEAVGVPLVWKVNGMLSGSGGFCESRRIVSDECRKDMARVYNECAHSRCRSIGERSFMWRQSVKSLRSSRKAAIARASFNVAYEFEDAFSSFSLPSPPEPVLFPRKMLNLKFAVLLMRSAYEAVDALDFIPMDKFQIKFWKLRQSEVEPYTLQCRPLRVKYGDLTDPVCAPLPLSFVVF